MKLIRALFASLSLIAANLTMPAAASPKAPEEAVIVHFRYGSKDLSALFQLEDRLEPAIAAAKAGEYDGHEIAVDGSDGLLYMYGPSADRLFDVVRPILEQTFFTKGAQVTKRYGPPGPNTKEVSVTIKP